MEIFEQIKEKREQQKQIQMDIDWLEAEILKANDRIKASKPYGDETQEISGKNARIATLKADIEKRNSEIEALERSLQKPLFKEDAL